MFPILLIDEPGEISREWREMLTEFRLFGGI